MAKLNFDKDCSPYYPPRARWYSGIFNLGHVMGRQMPWDMPEVPSGLGLWHTLAALLAPGMGVLLTGRKRLGLAAVALSFLLTLAFFIWLGYAAGNFAFGWLISLHVTSIGCYFAPSLVNYTLRARLSFTVLTLLAVSVLIYWPARDFIQGHWLIPLRVNGNVVVLHAIKSPRGIRAGEWIGYKINGSEQGEAHDGVGEVVMRSGMGLGPILAMPGDQVEFKPHTFLVNGVARDRLPNMPDQGRIVVPDRTWLIWPRMFVNNHNTSVVAIQRAVLEAALVPWENLAGKPFHRWMWRRQVLS